MNVSNWTPHGESTHLVGWQADVRDRRHPVGRMDLLESSAVVRELVAEALRAMATGGNGKLDCCSAMPSAAGLTDAHLQTVG
jgi:hypothetical protein